MNPVRDSGHPRPISNGMNNPVNNGSRGKVLPANTGRRGLPFFVEFVKFTAGFSAIIAAALIALHIAAASG